MQVLWSPYTPEALAAEQKQHEKGADGEGGDDDAAAAQQAAQLELRRLRSDPRCVLVTAFESTGMVATTLSVSSFSMLSKKGTRRRCTSADPLHPRFACRLKPAIDMITDEAGFLLEPKVRKHLEGLPTDEAGHVRLDALLEVLGITDAAGLAALVAALDPASDIELRAKGMGTTATRRPPAAAQPVFVGPDDVVRRLRAFVEAESASLQGGGPKSKAVGPRLGVSRRVLEREREFWHRVANVVDERGARTWDALHTHLEKYHDVLQAREQALRSVESLGQQNVELRALLNQYLSSQINSELQIPPTKLI